MSPRSVFAFLAVVGLVGCTTPHTFVPGWPELTVEVRRVEPAQVDPLCRPNGWTWWQVALLAIPMGCAWVDFDAATCTVIVADGSPDFILKHELEHCAGWDHGGVLQEHFDSWEARR